MSLLMDALKRAEQANQQTQAGAKPADPPPLALEPAAEALQMTADVEPGQASALPELSRLEALDDEFIAHVRQPPLRSKPAQDRGSQMPPPAPRPAAQAAGAPPAKPAGKDDTTAREAVKNAFAVKQAPRQSRNFGLLVGGTGILAAAAIGIYFWLQLQPSQGIAPRQPLASAPATRPAPPVAASPAAALPTSTEAETDSEARQRIPALPADVLRATAKAGSSSAAVGAHSQAAQTRLADGLEPIRFAKSRPKAEPASGEAHAALQAGNLALAKAAYQRVLDGDPRNADALHGLATIALREGRNEDAEAAYLRILEGDPRDAAANAGLFGLRTQGDSVASESRIKMLLAAQPDMPVLNFALGNVYARQNRWSEAQQAYFKAHAGDGENPDYLFNLAVSLDQLHQARLAAQYYGQALRASDHRPAAFDRGQASARLRELQP